MSEHDIAAKCARQVADLQAENERLRTQIAGRDAEIEELTEQIIEADSAYNTAGHRSLFAETSSLVRMCHMGSAALTENARLLTGLRAAKLTAATQAAKVGNGFVARGEWHKLAEQLQAVIDGPAYVAPEVIYEAALEVRAGTPLGLGLPEAVDLLGGDQ